MSHQLPAYRKPRERHDTKSLVRLGGEFVEESGTNDIAPRHSGTQLRNSAPRDSAPAGAVDGLPLEGAERVSEPVQTVDARAVTDEDDAGLLRYQTVHSGQSQDRGQTRVA